MKTIEVVISTEARQDILDIALWYDEQKEDLGNRFLARLTEIIQLIAHYPESYKLVYQQFRRAIATPYSYHVYYTLDLSQEKAVVVAVLHTRLSEENIQKRIS